MKITEKAVHPGTCFICAQPIHVSDVIVCSFRGVIPVAAHAQCDPDFAVGGSRPPEKIELEESMSEKTGGYKRMTVASYMQELVNYGRTMVPRGYVYQLLVNFATAQGHKNPRILADRWMQDYDIRQRLKSEGRLS